MSDYDYSGDSGMDFAAAGTPVSESVPYGEEVPYAETVPVDDSQDASSTYVFNMKDVQKGVKKATKAVTKGAAAASAAVETVIQVEAADTTATGLIKTGAWDARLFACFDFCVPNCLMATFCPCVSAAQIATRIGYSYNTVLLAFGVAIGIAWITAAIGASTMSSSESTLAYAYDPWSGTYTYGYVDANVTVITAWYYISWVVEAIVFIAFWQLRTKVREKFGLPGSCCEDFMISWCCSCCSLAQMATHTKTYKMGACDFGPPDTLEAYQN